MSGATRELRALGAAAAVTLMACTVAAAGAAGAAPAAQAPLKIGIIGAGHIGSSGRCLARASSMSGRRSTRAS